MKIAIIGQGYVGYALSVAATKAGHSVIGFDTNPKLISEIKLKDDLDNYLPTNSEADIKDQDIYIRPTNIVFGQKANYFIQEGTAKSLCGLEDVGFLSVEILKRGTIKESDFTILWKSDPIIASPICIRNDLNSAFVEKMKQIYLNLHIDNPAVFNAYIGTFHKNPKELSYIPIDDSLYNGIRKIANSVKDVALLKNF